MIPRPYCAANHGRLLLTSQLLGLQTHAFRAGSIAHQSRFVHDKRQQQVSKSPLLNPPESTRPPLLDVPKREPDQAAPVYYFNLGKAYIKFYKDGLKSIFKNRRLLRERLSSLPPGDRPSILKPYAVPHTFSRADWVLLWRVRHDMLRLPFFGLMLAAIGELTALVVLFVDGIVPYTCRIPKQIFGALEKAEQRRKETFLEFEGKYPHGPLSPSVTRSVAQAHVLKSLHLSGMMWDRLGFTPPGMWNLKGRLRMAFLEGDDKRLLHDGGPLGLECEELRIACAERGINVLGKSERELRGWLGDWLRLTAAEDLGERRRRMATLLLTRPENWPQQRDFAVPEWEL
ncbi:hypothetical protein PT974_11277 [Cladobotryum mycophilum]|uniref:Letm1 RBD domain-containing protein n=1 Tax=Cladobotryum mycophilum TaxID=491253 RepID=A0ABR0S4R6_9HYPO